MTRATIWNLHHLIIIIKSFGSWINFKSHSKLPAAAAARKRWVGVGRKIGKLGWLLMRFHYWNLMFYLKMKHSIKKSIWTLIIPILISISIKISFKIKIKTRMSVACPDKWVSHSLRWSSKIKYLKMKMFLYLAFLFKLNLKEHRVRWRGWVKSNLHSHFS